MCQQFLRFAACFCFRQSFLPNLNFTPLPSHHTTACRMPHPTYAMCAYLASECFCIPGRHCVCVGVSLHFVYSHTSGVSPCYPGYLCCSDPFRLHENHFCFYRKLANVCISLTGTTAKFLIFCFIVIALGLPWEMGAGAGAQVFGCTLYKFVSVKVFFGYMQILVKMN